VRSRRGPRLDGFELGALVLLGALSLWDVAGDLAIARAHGLVWTRTDGFFAVDQLQYLAWIQSSAHHWLIGDEFVLRPTPADYLQPAILLSGLLVRAGVAAWLALMLWKPVAVLAITLAAVALSRRCFERPFERRAALVLALFYASLSDVNGSLGVIGDMMSVWQSWGYPFGLVAVALITAGLIAYAEARRRGRLTVVPGVLGALAGSIHPWQGELMFLIVVIAELCRAPATLGARRADRAAEAEPPGGAGDGGWARPLGLAAVTLALVALPLLYYFGLGHLDPVWRAGQQRARHTFSATATLLAAAPLLAAALLGYRGRPRDTLELLLRAWVPAAVLIWVFSQSALGATPLHAVGGLPLPMAVLAVRGVRRAGLARLRHGRALAVLAIALVTIPATAYCMGYAHTFLKPSPTSGNFVTASESRALGYLAGAGPRGGVLAAFRLGQVVPGVTGRRTYVGDCLWSEPRCDVRKRTMEALLRGRMTPAAARRFVRGTGARWLLSGCGARRAAIARELRGAVAGDAPEGCATVWELRPPAGGQLAGSGRVRQARHYHPPPYASVRAPRRQ
jgi:hypothetical protein